MKRFFLPILMLLFVNLTTGYAEVATFDDLVPTVPPAQNYPGPGGGQFYNGSDGAGGFTSGGVNFDNNYNAAWDSWDGWSVSNTTDLTTAGFANQYSAYNFPAGGGHSGNPNDQYGVFWETYGAVAPTIKFRGPVRLSDIWITNTTYAYLAVVNGDDGAGYVKGPFGAGDFFKVTVTGYDEANNPTASLEILLADYRDANPANWFALDKWTQFNLSALGIVHGLSFDLDSSDTGAFGMNTPAFFAIDDLQYDPVPVPLTGPIWLLLLGDKTEE